MSTTIPAISTEGIRRAVELDIMEKSIDHDNKEVFKFKTSGNRVITFVNEGVRFIKVRINNDVIFLSRNDLSKVIDYLKLPPMEEALYADE